jgi:hypothetical protein
MEVQNRKRPRSRWDRKRLRQGTPRVSDEEIRRRAYEIYLERGEQPGGELEDWFQAERELARGVLSRAQAG